MAGKEQVKGRVTGAEVRHVEGGGTVETSQALQGLRFCSKLNGGLLEGLSIAVMWSDSLLVTSCSPVQTEVAYSPPCLLP